jgi:hypothetical protein
MTPLPTASPLRGETATISSRILLGEGGLYANSESNSYKSLP